MIKNNLPILFIRNHEIFPFCETKIEFDDINFKKAVSLSESYYDSYILLIHQREKDDFDSKKDINVGIIAKIKFKIDMPNGIMRISLKGLKRALIGDIKEEDSVYEAEATVIEKEDIDPIEEIAMSRTLFKTIDKYTSLIDNNPFLGITDIHNISKLTDIVVNLLSLSHNRKIKYLKEVLPTKRLKMLLDDLEYELSVLEIEKQIDLKVNRKMEDSQKEFYLREKLSVLKEELGDDTNTEITELESRIENLDCPENIKKRLEIEINRYKTLNSNSPEIGIIRNYIDVLLNLPWNIKSEDIKDIDKIKRSLDSSHFGMNETKNRILEHIMVNNYTKRKRNPILCLVGPPGIGKTSIATSIADAIGRKCIKISVGGVNDEAEIIGHRRTYVGASSGKIMSSIEKAGVNNPVFIIDEVDKMTKDIKGDPASALLEVLDPEQNNRFVDHFIDEEFDLSDVMFILTANYIDKIPDELKDRMEVIELGSYTEFEKLKITKSYIIPKLITDFKLEPSEIKISDATIRKIIKNYTHESGVRELERLMEKIFRRYLCRKLEEGKTLNIDDELDKILGIRKYQTNLNSVNIKGVVTGLSYTLSGGDIIKVEVTSYPGNGNIKITGLVGQVMEESVNVALDYIKSNYKTFGIDLKLINKNDFHIHIPNNAIKKDGPSAGITITTAILSYLKNIIVANNISMSGEVTLTGRILKVGGVKEKIIAAINNNVDQIYMPIASKEEIMDLEELHKGKLKIAFVDNYFDIYQDLFNKGDQLALLEEEHLVTN